MGYRGPRTIQVTRTYVLQKRQLRSSCLRYHPSCVLRLPTCPQQVTVIRTVLISLQSSLDKAKAWVKELQRQANENIIIALAGNKLDLVTADPSKRAITTSDAEAYARESGLLFFETSAKTAENVRELFTAIAKKLPLDQAGPRNMGGRAGGRQGVQLQSGGESAGVQGGGGVCNC